MNIIESVKRLFKRGGYIVSGQTLTTINDHPKINIPQDELDRIQQDFERYRNNYPKVEYMNSNGNLVKRDYMALNMIKTASEMLSSLIINEETEITVDGEANDYIQEVFQHNDFKDNLAKYLEPMLATGGVAARPYVDQNTGKVEFSWALANSFYPLKATSNGISEAVIVFKSSKVENKKTLYFTLFEFHEWNNNTIHITNELYKSDRPDVIGDRVPLGTDDQYEGLSDSSELKNMTKTQFTYLKPAGFNNRSLYSPLGLGICDNALTTLKQINDTYDQFNWEILMGQRTVAVSDALLDYLPDENNQRLNASFDPHVNVYKSFRMEQDDPMIKDLTSDIRSEQYINSINQFMKTLEMQMQLSVGTFSFDGKSVKTATEVVSENSLTYRTRKMQCNQVEKFIKNLVISVLELSQATKINGKSLYSGEIPLDEDISVVFDDGVFQSQDAKAEYYAKLVTAGLISKLRATQAVLGVTEEEARAIVSEINAETLGMDYQEQENKVIIERFGEEE